METGFVVLLLVVVAVFSAVGGMWLGRRRAERRYANDTALTQGTLNVDCVDPDFPLNMYLGLSIPINTVISRKYVTLDVNVMLNNSRK